MQKVIFVTHEEQCFKYSTGRFIEVPALKCTPEEADGCLLFHASQAAEVGYEAMMISSSGTDVLVLSIAFCSSIKAPLFQKSGTSSRTQMIGIGNIFSSLWPSICSSLLGLHAFKGCDSVSSFSGKEKITALTILKSNKNFQEAFSSLHQNWTLPDELFGRLEVYMQTLSKQKTNVKINELRYQLFCAKNCDIESHLLPPCHDCLLKHGKRANYQAGLWRCYLENKPNVPDPVENG